MSIRYLLFLVAMQLSVVAWGQDRTVGLVKYSHEVSEGYTLISSIVSPDTYLVNTCGEVVHTWTSDYYPGNTVRLMANGNLLRATKVESIRYNAGGAGGRIEILDWDSSILWEFTYESDLYRHHHDVIDLPNGNLLLLAWDGRNKEEAIAAGRNPENLGNMNEDVWGEHLLEVKPLSNNGYEIVWEWYLWDHLVQDFDNTKANFGVVSENPNKIDINYDVVPGNPDWIHANGIEYNPKLDQLVISSRNFNELWIIDHSTTTEEARTGSGGNTGKGGDIVYRYGNPQTYRQGDESDRVLFGQHNPQWANYATDDDLLVVFNNGNGRIPEYSTIDFVRTPIQSDGTYSLSLAGSYSPNLAEKIYSSSSIEGFEYSSFISSIQQLENGNLFICAGANGTIIEIDPEGNTLWNYVSPITSMGIVEQGFDFESTLGVSNIMFRAYKYPIDHPGLAGRDLVSSGPIEQNPVVSLCEEITALEPAATMGHLYPIPASTNLYLDLVGYEKGHIAILDTKGSQVLAQKVTGNSLNIDISDLNNGLYFFKLFTDNQIIMSEKFIKTGQVR